MVHGGGGPPPPPPAPNSGGGGLPQGGLPAALPLGGMPWVGTPLMQQPCGGGQVITSWEQLGPQFFTVTTAPAPVSTASPVMPGLPTPAQMQMWQGAVLQQSQAAFASAFDQSGGMPPPGWWGTPNPQQQQHPQGGGGMGPGGGGRPPDDGGSKGIVCVGFLGMAHGAAEVANNIANRPDFTDSPPAPGADPEERVPVQCFHCADRAVTHLYLPPAAVSLDELWLQANEWNRARAEGGGRPSATALIDYLEDRQISYLRSLLYVLTVCQVVIVIHRGLTFDLAYIRLFRILRLMRQQLQPSCDDLMHRGLLGSGVRPVLSGAQFAPGRLMPIVAFVFAVRRTADGGAVQKAEQGLDAQVRHFLRSGHIAGGPAERDDHEYPPLLILDPQRCAFVIHQPHGPLDSAPHWRSWLLAAAGVGESCDARGSAAAPDASVLRRTQAVREFIGRQQNYFLRQSTQGGKRYEPLPSAAAWRCEQAVIDILTRLDSKLLSPQPPHPVLTEHTAFRRLHQMLNPLHKLSWARCGHARDCALSVVASFIRGLVQGAGREEQQATLSDPGERHAQWHQCSSVFASYAIGPLMRDLFLDTKDHFDRRWHQAMLRAGAAPRDDRDESYGTAPAPDTRYDGSQDALGAPGGRHRQREDGRDAEDTAQKINVVSTCGRRVTLVLPQLRHCGEACALNRAAVLPMPCFAAEVHGGPPMQHACAHLVVVDQLPCRAALLDAPAGHGEGERAGQPLPPLCSAAIADWLEANMAQVGTPQQGAKCFAHVEQVRVAASASGSAVLTRGDGTEHQAQRWAATDGPGLGSEAGRARPLDILHALAAVPGGLAAWMAQDADGEAGARPAAGADAQLRKQKDGRRARRRREPGQGDGDPGAGCSAGLAAVRRAAQAGEGRLSLCSVAQLPQPAPLHAVLHVALEYQCALTQVRFTCDLAAPGLGFIPPPERARRRPAPDAGPSAAVCRCDVPLFIPTPQGVASDKRPGEASAQLQRVYVATDHSGAVWRLRPSFAFFHAPERAVPATAVRRPGGPGPPGQAGQGQGQGGQGQRPQGGPAPPSKHDICNPPPPPPAADSDDGSGRPAVTLYEREPADRRPAQGEELAALLSSECPVGLPPGRVVALRVPQLFPPLDLRDYRARRASCYLLHDFITLAG